jgi:hypothetical protein
MLMLEPPFSLYASLFVAASLISNAQYDQPVLFLKVASGL